MSALAKVPFLGGYTEQSDRNAAETSGAMRQFQQLLALTQAQQKQAEARKQQDMLKAYAATLKPDEQLEFQVDPKGFLSGRRNEREIAAFTQNAPKELPQELTGFEPLPNGVPGQQGMVGNVGKMLQDVARRQDLPMEDKQAIIAQIFEQQRGAASPADGMSPGLLSTNPIVRAAAQFQQTQKDKREAAEATRAFQRDVVEQGRNDRAALLAATRQKTPEELAAAEDAKLAARKRQAEALAQIPGTAEHTRAQTLKGKQDKVAKDSKALTQYVDGVARSVETSLSDILGVPVEELETALTAKNPTALIQRLGPTLGTIQGREWMPTFKEVSGNVESAIANLKNKAQMYGLTNLRKTGVAPGSITEREWPKFESILANIDRTLGEKAFLKQMLDILRQTQDMRRNAQYDTQAWQEQLGGEVPVNADGWEDM